MKVQVRDLGAVGLITDVDAVDLPPNGWTVIENARCKDKKVQPVDGHADITAWVNSGTKEVYAHSICSLQKSDGFYLVFPYDTTGNGAADAIYEFSGTASTDITRAASVTPYTAPADAEWTSCNYHGFVILNNGVDAPQYYGEGSTDCADLPWNSTRTWTDVDGAGATYAAAVVRSYKDLLVALNINDDGTRYPSMIHWSDVADPDNLPEWDYTSASSISGRAELSATAGALLDAVVMRDSLILYKEDAIYQADFVGGEFVLNFRALSDSYGLYATGCVVDVGGVHVVLGDGVLYQFDGSTATNVLHGRVARSLFDQIDPTYYYRAHLAHDIKKAEVLVNFPEIGKSWCTKSLIWNYRDNTFYYRTLPPLSAMVTAVNPETKDDDTWDVETALTWDAETERVWLGRLYSPIGDVLIAAGEQLHKFDEGVTADKVTLTRTNLMPDAPAQWFLTTELNPLATGDQFDIQIGGQLVLDGPVYWESNQTFNPGTDYKVDSLSNYPIKALRITSTGKSWTLSGYVAHMEPTGQR